MHRTRNNMWFGDTRCAPQDVWYRERLCSMEVSTRTHCLGPNPSSTPDSFEALARISFQSVSCEPSLYGVYSVITLA